MSIDFKKPVQQRNGGKVRIYANDAGGKYPIRGAWYNYQHEEWWPRVWMEDGKFVDHSVNGPHDLVNVPEVKKVRDKIYYAYSHVWQVGAYSVNKPFTAVEYTITDGKITNVEIIKDG